VLVQILFLYIYITASFPIIYLVTLNINVGNNHNQPGGMNCKKLLRAPLVSSVDSSGQLCGPLLAVCGSAGLRVCRSAVSLWRTDLLYLLDLQPITVPSNQPFPFKGRSALLLAPHTHTHTHTHTTMCTTAYHSSPNETHTREYNTMGNLRPFTSISVIALIQL